MEISLYEILWELACDTGRMLTIFILCFFLALISVIIYLWFKRET